MAVPTFTKNGTKAATAASLDKAVFGAKPKNHELLKSAYVAHLADRRTNTAQTKKRGEVSGGGRKPWKQKGTGRARFGSSRNPIWRGGGIAFGPTGNENHAQKLNVSAKHTALRQALSIAASENRIVIIETFECKEGKVAATIKLFDKVAARGNILLVVSHKDDLVLRATRNISNLKVVQASYLNVYDIINADSMVISQKALQSIHEWLGKAKK